MKTRLLTLTFILLCTSLFAQKNAEKEPQYVPVQISFIPGFGTAGFHSGLVSTTVSLNILGGYVYKVDGVEMGSLINVVHNDMNGVQLSGLVNIVGNDVTGLQMAGLSNVVIGQSNCAQLSGLANVNVGRFKGGQLAGMVNYANSIKGIQGSGIVNAAVDSVDGGQIGGLINYAGSVSGLQAAGLINVSAKEVDGVQISGLVNFAPRVKGVQIGLINIADSVESGAVIGLFNFVRKGMHKFEASYEDVLDFNLSFRGGTKQFYNIWTVGLKPQNEAFWSLGAGFGTQIDLKSKLYTNIEATTNWLQLTDNKNFDLDGHYTLNRLNINAGYKINQFLSVNAGPVLNVFIENGQEDPSDNPLINLGSKNFFDKKVNDSNVRMWLGYRVAIRF